MLSEIFIFSLAVAFIIVVWKETDAFIEYSELLKLDGFLKVKEYKQSLKVWKKLEPPFKDFPSYLAYIYPNSFFIKIITCPICLATWLSLVSVLVWGLVYWLAISFLSSFLYFLMVRLIRSLDSFH